MYKCTECGMEYEVKPDYCDCGNDEFVLTVEKEPEPVIEIKKEEPPEIESAKVNVEPIRQTVKDVQYKLPVSPFALIAFVACILLSILILFVWNPNTDNPPQPEEQEHKHETVKNIPSIDKLWKDPEPVKVEPVKQEEQVKQEPIVQKPKVQTVVKKPATTQKQQKTTTVVPLTKNTSTKIAQTTKPKTTTKTTTAPTQQQSVQDTEAQKAAEAAKKAAEEKLKAENEAKLAAEKARQASLSKQEYANYKIALRNTIGKKIDFTKVVGDGDCVVSFKLDSSGNLINRSFAKQSTNLTLNNAVYKAVMATPTFTQPPSAYKNETLRLNISFNNGNFAITIE